MQKGESMAMIPGAYQEAVPSQPFLAKMFQNVPKCSKDWGRLNLFESPNLFQLFQLVFGLTQEYSRLQISSDCGMALA